MRAAQRCLRPLCYLKTQRGAATLSQPLRFQSTSADVVPSHPPGQRVTLKSGASMAYVDTLKGATPAVFLHGNPTSSFLWRNVIPEVSSSGEVRCFAPDLIGMGHSDKHPTPESDTAYTFRDHAEHLDNWFEDAVLPSTGGEKIVLVIHDWGSALGFHWAFRNQDKVAAIVHMESVVAPITWEQFPESGRKVFQGMRTPEVGEAMVLQKNVFVERILPSSIMRKLSDEEMAEYVRPFANPGSDRLPTLTWPRQIPFLGDGPQDVIDIAQQYSDWLATSTELPKLYIHAKPGFFADFIKEHTSSWPNQRMETVKGIHFLQEDSGAEIGRHVADFIASLD